MAIITISRGSFSGGKMLAECLAAALGYRCVDRDTIVERATAFGVTQEELRNALDRPPTFFDRFHRKKATYLCVIQAALLEEVRSGNAVYHGNAGHFLLGGIPHVLRTRIIAPVEFRLAMTQERMQMGQAEALAYIQKVDEERARWTRFLYGVDWGDPSFYDLVVNLERMDIREACDTIAAAARHKCFEETATSRAVAVDLTLASRVKARLATAPATAQLELEVTARDGVVKLRGSAFSQEQIHAIRDLASGVSGVKEVDVGIHVAGTGA